VDEAREAGHEVRVYDALLYEDLYLKDVDFAFGDVLDMASLQPHLDWADTVIYLAGYVGDSLCALNPAQTRRVNVDAIKLLVERFNGQIVFPSTCSVYGAQFDELNENSPVMPLSLYAETKLIAEKILLRRTAPTQIFRLGTLFGMSDRYSRIRLDLVLNTLTVRAVLEGKMSVFGGHQFRPLLHVRDVASAMVPCIGRDRSGLYNLHAENLTILELARRIQAVVTSAVIETTESEFQDLRSYRVTSQKARQEIGFLPNFSIEDGIQEVAEVVRSHRIKNVDQARFSNVSALLPLLGSRSK
jgi:nucleoside-diphosphate-sugar epimerase